MRRANWIRILVALAAAALLVGLSGTVLAGAKGKKAKKKGPAITTVTGDLTKTATKKGKLTGASIKGADGKIIKVFLDRQGVKLAKALAGKKVEVSGVLSMRGKGKARKTWLRVKTFKEVAPPAAEPADEEEEGDGDL